MRLSDYLKQRSKEICALNTCTEDEHRCEVYAYIREDMELLDVCSSDYFQGCSRPHAVIMLPWSGTQQELEEEVQDQCEEMTV